MHFSSFVIISSGKAVALHLNKIKSPSFSNFIYVFSLLLCYMYLPLDKDMDLHLNKLKFFLAKNILCQVWL